MSEKYSYRYKDIISIDDGKHRFKIEECMRIYNKEIGVVCYKDSAFKSDLKLGDIDVQDMVRLMAAHVYIELSISGEQKLVPACLEMWDYEC